MTVDIDRMDTGAMRLHPEQSPARRAKGATGGMAAVDSPPRAGRREWLALAVLMLPVLTISLDNTVLSFAVPQLTQSLQPSSLELLWILDIYPLALASLLVTMGMLGDRWGRRRLLLVGAAGFALVGLYAAFAPSAAHLIIARALRGVFGAMLMPSTMSLLRNIFWDPAQRRLAIAIWAAGYAGGTALGPIVGGMLLERYSWGSAFLLTIPCVVLLLILGPKLLPESSVRGGGRIDVVGIIWSILAMLPLVYGVKEAATNGWNPAAIMAPAIGIAATIVFVRRQLASADPLLDVRLFANPIFSASIAANFLSVFAFAGLVFYLSQYLQLVLGLSPVTAGVYLLPGAVVTIVFGLLAVPWASRFPLSVLVPGGILVSAIGYACAGALSTHSGGWLMMLVFALVGMGAGLAETLTNDAILAGTPAERAGAAAGLSETAYELGASFGVAILGSLMVAIYRSDLQIPVGVTAQVAEQAQQTLGGAATVAAGLPPEAGQALWSAAQQAFVHGAQVTSIIAALVCVVTAVIVTPALRHLPR